MKLNKLKNIVQSAHINFLFGSGLSRPYLNTLGNIETWLTEAESISDDKVRDIVKTSLYVKYYLEVMEPCLESKIKAKGDDYKKVLDQYEEFISCWNTIIAKRNNGLIDKQINIFSTNIDTFVEQAAENTGVEFNDGFKGHITPIFREDCFTNVVTKVSPIFQNTSLIPIFNYLKMHGSINWKSEGEQVLCDSKLSQIEELAPVANRLGDDQIIKIIEETDTIGNLKSKAEDIKGKAGYNPSDDFNGFKEKYSDLIMINPRKAKFRESVLELHFYELLRLFSNALEMNTTLLLVAGFSFADEHIAKITLRAANANPTLLVIVFAFDNKAKVQIESNLKKAGSLNNNNILVLDPDTYKDSQEEDDKNKFKDLTHFDFESLNKYVFKEIEVLVK